MKNIICDSCKESIKDSRNYASIVRGDMEILYEHLCDRICLLSALEDIVFEADLIRKDDFKVIFHHE